MIFNKATKLLDDPSHFCRTLLISWVGCDLPKWDQDLVQKFNERWGCTDTWLRLCLEGMRGGEEPVESEYLSWVCQSDRLTTLSGKAAVFRLGRIKEQSRRENRLIAYSHPKGFLFGCYNEPKSKVPKVLEELTGKKWVQGQWPAEDYPHPEGDLFGEHNDPMLERYRLQFPL